MDEREREAHLQDLKAEAIEKLYWKVSDVTTAVRVCLDNRAWEPALILLYSGIDAQAWIGCPPGQDDVTRHDFINWVTTYLLPIPDADCSAEDLYAARCGLLHTHTADSRMNRKKQARRVYYHRRVGDQILGTLQVRMKDTLSPVSIDVDVMLSHFERGVLQFAHDLASDSDRFTTAVSRVITSYLAEVDWHGPPCKEGVTATVIRR
jgi:hypothetical protein